jgi:hypothetical protein
MTARKRADPMLDASHNGQLLQDRSTARLSSEKAQRCCPWHDLA